MEEIIEKRDIINQKLNYLAHATNNANHRKLKCGLIKELTVLDNRAQKILSAKLVDGKLTLEKFEVSEVTKYKNKKGKILYPTGYVPIENEPAAFIGNETVLKEFNIFPKTLDDEDIRRILCDEQENNDKIVKNEEEEEEYEEFVIPKIKKN